jgi:tripartite-type tricarboxylate transporter receptor subunit TctC
MDRRTCLIAIPAIAASLLAAPAGANEPWPSKPIRLLVPGTPGSSLDLMARNLAQGLQASLKQPVIVDNKPGASGMLATRAAMAAAPDGYVLMYSNASSTVMYSALKPDLGIDFTRNVVPVALTSQGGVMLVVHPSFPAKDLKELVAVVKANPGKYNYASWAIGSNGHLSMEWLKSYAGLKMDHVPYKGIVAVLTDVSGGVVPMGWADISGSLAFIQSGRVRPIAVNGTSRTPLLPDLPTMDEQGFPLRTVGWQGVFAPHGTPPELVQRINAEINRIQSTPEHKAAMLKLNAEPPPAWTPEQFRAMMVRDAEVYRKIAEEAKITVD